MRAVRCGPENLARIAVDTTVQPKNIAFPTDAKPLHAAIKGLNRLAGRHAVWRRQSNLRVAKRAARSTPSLAEGIAGRYATPSTSTAIIGK